MSKKDKTDEERARIDEYNRQRDARNEAHHKRANIATRAIQAAEGASHVADRVELVKRYVAGVSQVFEELMRDHQADWAQLAGALDAPSDALGRAAAEYAGGGRLGDFLLALDAYNVELRRIVAELPVRSLSD
jgi:hypothetical protein